MSRIKPYLFTVTFVILLVSTYFNAGKYILMIIVAVDICCMLKAHKVLFHNKSNTKWYVLFCSYYIMISICGVIFGNVDAKKLIENICLYVGIPVYLHFCISNRMMNRDKSAMIFRNFVILSFIYGFLEQVSRKNILSCYISNDAANWLRAFEQSSSFQCSSFYLHYNYYGCILIVGYILLMYYPLRNKLLNFVAIALTFEQLLACQSRMSWITMLIILLSYACKSSKITSKSVRKILGFGGLLVIFMLLFPSVPFKLMRFVHVRFLNIFIHGMNDGSLGQRIGTLLNWRHYFISNPLLAIFGTGYQSIGKIYLKKYSYFGGYSTADCLVTTYLVETGIVGALFLASFLIAKIRKYRKTDSISYYFIVLFILEGLTLDLSSNYYVLFVLVSSFFFDKKMKWERR